MSRDAYQRIRQLGQGGMGVVYEVLEVAKDRRVALKTLRSEDPDLLFRLKREFRNLAGLIHHNLVELYDLVADREDCFYTMELIDGVDFLENCRDRGGAAAAFDEPRLRDALKQVIRGVSALHAAGKIHRDIKPSNVLVARNGRVVLVDFGLVSDLTDITNLTLTAHVVGTAAYMAPEQCENGTGVDGAADLYSVGVMLFEALTGSRPFDGSVLQVLREKTSKVAPDPRELVPNLPEDLVELCVGLLEREVGKRPTLDQVSRALSRDERETVSVSMASRRPEVAFTGRQRELQTLKQEFKSVVAGAFRAVVVQGPSGIGKTALIRQFLSGDSLQSNVVALSGRCYPREAIPYSAIDSLIDQLSEYWRRLSHAEAMYLVPREPEYLTLAFPVLKRVRELTEHDVQPAVQEPREARARAVAALRETLQRLCRRNPLVLLLDDMQWVDADSAQLLRSLADSADAPGILLVIACQPVPADDPAHALLEALFARATKIDLEPLSQADTCALIQHISRNAAEGDVQSLAQEAGGSPFFAELLARHADTAAKLEHIDLRGLLLTQLQEQSELGQSLLRLASVALRPLAVAVAARALDATAEQVAREVRILNARRLTKELVGQPVERLEFYHERIRNAAVDALAPEARRELNRRLAFALAAEAHADREACSHHFFEAGERTLAAEHARAAAEAAEEQLAFDRAARAYARCLELDPPTRPAECELRTRLGAALSNAGRGPEAARQFLLAAALAEPNHAIELQWRAAEQFLRSGYSKQGTEAAQVVVRKLGLKYPQNERLAWLSGYMRHAKNKLLVGKAPVRSPGAESEHLLRQIDVSAGIAQCIGYVAPALSYYFQTVHVSLALSVGEPVRLCRALCTEANYAAIGGDETPRATNLLARAADLARSTNDPRARGIVALTEGTMAFFLGRWQQASVRCTVAEELLKRECTGVQWELDTAMLYALSGLHYTGKLKQLGERVRSLIEEAELRNDAYALTILRAGLSHILFLAEDDPNRVALALESVMGAWPQEEFSVPRYWELMSRFHVALYQGEPQRASEEFERRREQIDASLPRKVQVTRVRINLARARIALAVAEQKVDRRENEKLVLALARDIEREGHAWTHALAVSLDAGAAALRGDLKRAVMLLDVAERELADADMMLEAVASRYRRGELLQGAEGARLIAEANAWLAAQSVRNPRAFLRMIAPGYGAGS